MYAVITDFSLQLQRSQRTGTELGTACRRRCRTPIPLDRRDRSHTKRLDRPVALVPVRAVLAPVRRLAPSAAAARERPRHGACHGASRSRRRQRVAALRDAGAWTIRTQRWHTPALGALALGDERPCLGTCMPGCTDLRLGAPVGAAMAYTRHAGEGCAGRFASGRGVDRPSGLSNRPGLRVPATPSGHGPSGLGRPRARGAGGVRTGGRAGRLPRSPRTVGGRGTGRRG